MYYVNIKINISHDNRSRKKAVGLTVESFMNLSPPLASEIGLLCENNKVNWSFFSLVIYFYLFMLNHLFCANVKIIIKLLSFCADFGSWYAGIEWRKKKEK